MPNTNFVPNWTFERTLPSPFDSYSGKKCSDERHRFQIL